MRENDKIIFTGGGSGGHTMPAFSMIDTVKTYFKDNDMNLDILYIGSETGIEKKIAVKNNIKFTGISTGKLRRYLSFKNFTDIFNILQGIIQSLKIIKTFKPDLVISTGGYVSVPPVIAAKLRKIPVIIHEQTIDAGLANKIASKFADKVALTFEESKKYFPSSKVEITGIPLRKEIFSGSKQNAFKKFGFDNKLPVLYFTGGGLGCHILNQTALKILPDILQKTNVIFQSGKSESNNDYEELVDFYKSLDNNLQKRMKLYDFIHEDQPDVFAIADAAVARSGAGTVNEFLVLNIPAIFIPLAIATNSEQYKNAMIPVKLEGAVIIEEKELTPDLLYKSIEEILFTGKYREMKENLKRSGAVNGNENMLKLILNYLVNTQ